MNDFIIIFKPFGDHLDHRIIIHAIARVDQSHLIVFTKASAIPLLSWLYAIAKQACRLSELATYVKGITVEDKRLKMRATHERVTKHLYASTPSQSQALLINYSVN
jgi:hypothetical protein